MVPIYSEGMIVQGGSNGEIKRKVGRERRNNEQYSSGLMG